LAHKYDQSQATQGDYATWTFQHNPTRNPQCRNNNNDPTPTTQQTHTNLNSAWQARFSKHENPIVPDANTASTKETIPDTTAQTQHDANCKHKTAETRDRTGDLQIFSLTLSQLSYRGR
jgi:hypothetical protein